METPPNELNLSSEDVNEIIKNKHKTDTIILLNYTLTPIKKRIGLLGDYAILNTSIKFVANGQAAHQTYFVKFFPHLEEPARFAKGIGAFAKEIFMYETLDRFRHLEIRIADSVVCNCYLKKADEVIVLDDLMEQGYRALNKGKYLDYDSVEVILQALSRIHAASLIYEEKMSEKKGGDYRWTDDYGDELKESFFNDDENFCNRAGIEASIRGVLGCLEIFNFPPKLPSGKEFKSVLGNLCYEVYNLVKPSQKYRNVLCHGDLWATNFLMKYHHKDKRPTDVKFVDFQCGRYTPPSHDVLSLIYLTTSRDFRNKFLYSLVGFYYSNLEKHLNVAGYRLDKLVPFEEFLQSCEQQKVFAMVQAAIYFPLILINEDEVEKYFSDKELNRKTLFEDRSYLVVEHMHKDEDYKNRIVEAIEDLQEYCAYL